MSGSASESMSGTTGVTTGGNGPDRPRLGAATFEEDGPGRTDPGRDGFEKGVLGTARDGAEGGRLARRGRGGRGGRSGSAGGRGAGVAGRARRWAVNLLYVAVAVVVVALFRSLVLQSFIIPSGSMEDTLSEGDRVVVTMYDSEDVSRGDIVVFTDPDGWLDVEEPAGLQGLVQDVLVAVRILPQDAGHHLIKRVIGMPGDHVVADGQGSLSVNGAEVSEPYLKPGRSASDVPFDVTVPEGYVWVMGDNRSNSADSRFHRDDVHGGFVPLDNVVGVAKAVEWPVTHWKGLGSGEEAFQSVPEPSSAPTALGPQRREGPDIAGAPGGSA